MLAAVAIHGRETFANKYRSSRTAFLPPVSFSLNSCSNPMSPAHMLFRSRALSLSETSACLFLSYRGSQVPVTAITTPAKKPRKSCLASLINYSIHSLCSSMWWTMSQQASTTSSIGRTTIRSGTSTPIICLLLRALRLKTLVIILS